MTELPDTFKCTITNWEYIYGLSREVSDQIKESAYEPDMIVALARGGWFAGRCLCDFLGLDDLTSLKMEHYVGTAEKASEPVVRYPLPEGSVEGKTVLVVDDIADTGQSLTRAHSYVADRNPDAIRTATLQLLSSSEFTPDYVGEQLDDWAWIVYPWNFIEDMIELIQGVLTKADIDHATEPEIRDLLATYHQIERIQFEIAQPNRLPEILEEMTRRGLLEETDGAWRVVE